MRTTVISSVRFWFGLRTISTLKCNSEARKKSRSHAEKQAITKTCCNVLIKLTPNLATNVGPI